MRNEVIINIENIFKEIVHPFGIDTKDFTYFNRKPFIEQLQKEQSPMAEAFQKLINDLESLSFTKTDKELRFKAPDIYEIEMKRIKNDIEESKSNLKSFFEDTYIHKLINEIDLI